MAYWTVANLRAKIQRETDTEDELFIKPAEFYDYINDAVRDAAAHMLKLGVHDQYYLSKETFPVVADQEDYTLPTRIYANKILKMVYKRNQTDIYEVKRLTHTKRFLEYDLEKLYTTSTDYYRYFLRNDLVETPPASGTFVPTTYIMLVPTPNLSGGEITMWYVREPVQVSLDTDYVDVPEEVISFIMASVRVRVYEKEVGHPSLEKAIGDKREQQQLMIEALSDQTQDEDNFVEMDMTHYEESI